MDFKLRSIDSFNFNYLNNKGIKNQILLKKDNSNYIIEGEKGSGEVTLNGPAARKVQKGDVVIILSYAQMEVDKAKFFKPTMIFPNENTNRLN